MVGGDAGQEQLDPAALRAVVTVVEARLRLTDPAADHRRIALDQTMQQCKADGGGGRRTVLPGLAVAGEAAGAEWQRPGVVPEPVVRLVEAGEHGRLRLAG